MSIYNSEFQQRHERNKRLLSGLFRVVRKPYVFLPLGTILFYIWWQTMEVGNVNEQWAMSLFWIFAGLTVLLLIVAPFYIIFKVSQKAGRAWADRKAVHVSTGEPNGDSIRFIQNNYKLVFANVGLCLRDDQKSAQVQAGAAAASLYGRGRIARLGATSALAADAFLNKQVPELTSINPVDEYKTVMFFVCPAGVTVGMFDELSDEIASGFRVPRVTAEQSSQQRQQGIVELDIFHRDVLEEKEDFDVQGWFDDE